MSDDHIKNALNETIKQFTDLIAHENELERKKWELQKQRFKLLAKITSLAALCDDVPPNSFIGRFTRDIEHTGLTVAIRNILEGTGEWMSVAQLRDQLLRFRIDAARYKNPSSTIHTILGRFVKSGQAQQKTDPKTKKPIFRAVPPDFGALRPGDPEETREAAVLSLLEPEGRKRREKQIKTVKLLEGKK